MFWYIPVILLYTFKVVLVYDYKLIAFNPEY